LLCDDEVARTNLLQSAACNGVAASKLVFARRLGHSEHLARHRLADLFLDTFPYNAHTTASDALWMGLPVLTVCGLSFASRVAASLLSVAGLNELVMSDLDSYEQKAVRLANTPHELNALRRRLDDGRLQCPLFAVEGFTRALECAYGHMVTRWQAKEMPSPFRVHPSGQIVTCSD
jgi:protein O-GlcNAc transferase